MKHNHGDVTERCVSACAPRSDADSASHALPMAGAAASNMGIASGCPRSDKLDDAAAVQNKRSKVILRFDIVSDAANWTGYLRTHDAMRDIRF